MTISPFDPVSIDQLPDILPLFPLGGTLLLPRGRLPLNVFEPRYLSLVNDVLRSPSRMVGIVQPRDESNQEKSPALYDVGCAGRIARFEETEDGRYLIVLTGVSRFVLDQEIDDDESTYRQAHVIWDKYIHDLKPAPEEVLKRESLIPNLKRFFNLHDLSADWNAVDDISDEQLITTLAMACPFNNVEKQALLESTTVQDRAQLLAGLIEMAILERRRKEKGHHDRH